MGALRSDMFPRIVTWRRILDDATMEQMILTRQGDGYRLDGLVVGAEAQAPLRVDYAVECDGDWRTKTCSVAQRLGTAVRTLHLHSEGERWLIDGEHDASLDGCTDVDLGISPSTNTLPIHRLGLAVGERRDIRAAWVKFPALNVVAAAQSYERTGERAYIYRSLDSGFTARLDLDEAGLVVLYEKIWRRIAASAEEIRPA